jgi:pimeloyl-ACP methyl ester carboxylesterase
MLDGGDQRQYSAEVPLYSRSVAVLAALERDGLAPMILVGVENRNRVRDMTPVERPDLYVGGGGSPVFLRFLETELVPFVEARWRVGRTRILYGESYGGLFVLDAFARGRQVFTDYISVSPTVGVWPKGLAAALRQRMSAAASPATRAGEPHSTSTLFVIYGEKDASLVTDDMPSVAQLVETERPPTLRFGVEILPRAGHNPPHLRMVPLGHRGVPPVDGPSSARLVPGAKRGLAQHELDPRDRCARAREERHSPRRS